jgi:integrase/recombinase XerD
VNPKKISTMAVTASITLDTRRIKKTGKYPVKLLVTLNSEPRRYQTVFDLSQDDYDKLSGRRLNPELQTFKDKLNEILRTAKNAIKDLQPFTFANFEADYLRNNPMFRERKFGPPSVQDQQADFDFSPYYRKFPILNAETSNPQLISATFVPYVRRLLEQGRIGSAENYQDTYNSLIKFKGNVRFIDITVNYLYRYEQWMIGRGRSKTTVGIKLRALRAVFNEAIEQDIINRRYYPFGRRRYMCPTSKNVKKALDISTIAKIYYYAPPEEDDRRAKDFWLFCYFGNGMNPKDLAHLKFKNLQGEYLHFERAKTINTTRGNTKLITAYITDDMRKIIERQANKDQSPNNYIFPILELGGSSLGQHYAIKSFVLFINRGMARIAGALGIDRKVSTIVTRHTFSTLLKRSGASTEFIQEALGHMDKKTTENYLDSFENEVKKEYSEVLTSFKLSVVKSKSA